MFELTADLIAELKSVDTPTVCNALEILVPERRGYGTRVINGTIEGPFGDPSYQQKDDPGCPETPPLLGTCTYSNDALTQRGSGTFCSLSATIAASELNAA